MKLNVLELFAGVGGFRLGLEGWNGKSAISGYEEPLKRKVQFEVVHSNQFEPSTKRQHANEVYESRFGPVGHFGCSVEEVGASDFSKHIDVLCGGFPCQDYSVATTLRNSKGLLGKKGVLWWEIERLLTELVNKPPYLILENVDRLLKSPSGRRGRDFAVMLRSLSELGYNVEWKVIDASEWGFPQRRKRVFIVGYHRSISDKYLGLLESAFPFESKLSSREFELDADIETISNDFGVRDLVSKFGNDGHYINGVVYTSDVRYEKIEGNVLADILEPIECVSSDYHVKDIDFEKWVYLKGAKKIIRTSKNGHSYNFAEGAMSFPDSLNKPSRTIITSEGGATPSRFKHVILQDNVHRRLTPKELERLNGFPDDWTRVEGINDSRRSFFMGNALVVGIIEMIADALSEYHYQSTISRLSK